MTEEMQLKEMIEEARHYRSQIEKLENEKITVERKLEALNEKLRVAIDVSEEAYTKLSEEEFQLMLSELNDPELITIEVVYATRERQGINEIQVCRGASIEDCIAVSGIADDFPEIDLARAKVGVHGAIKPLTEPVREGDRIEIYRPVEAPA